MRSQYLLKTVENGFRRWHRIVNLAGANGNSILPLMKALQLIAHGEPGKFELRELADPQAGPGEVVVEVKACGLNHLDLWTEEGELPIPVELPRTPGCETAGMALNPGPGGPGWRPDARDGVA